MPWIKRLARDDPDSAEWMTDPEPQSEMDDTEPPGHRRQWSRPCDGPRPFLALFPTPLIASCPLLRLGFSGPGSCRASCPLRGCLFLFRVGSWLGLPSFRWLPCGPCLPRRRTHCHVRLTRLSRTCPACRILRPSTPKLTLDLSFHYKMDKSFKTYGLNRGNSDFGDVQVLDAHQYVGRCFCRCTSTA